MRVRTHIFESMLKFLITRYAVGYDHHSRTSLLLFHSDNEANAGYFQLFLFGLSILGHCCRLPNYKTNTLQHIIIRFVINNLTALSYRRKTSIIINVFQIKYGSFGMSMMEWGLPKIFFVLKIGSHK